MEQVTSDQLFAEIGSLHMALKVAREQRDALARELEALRAVLVQPRDGALDLAREVPPSPTI